MLDALAGRITYQWWNLPRLMTGDLDHASRRKPRDFRDIFTLETWVKQYEQTIPQSSPFLLVV